MDSAKLRELLRQEEGAKLDFKIKLHDIYGSDKERQWDELIKDILSLANGNIGTAGETGYLIIGVGDRLKADGTRDLLDVGEVKLTRKQLLDKVNSACEPPLPDICCQTVTLDTGEKLFVISIPRSPYLHKLNRQLRTPKKEFSTHTILIRRKDGEKIYEASDEEKEAIQVEKLNCSSPQLYKEISENIYNASLSLIVEDFVGREYVFDFLEDFIKNNSKGYFIIEGDPGIGKTTILAEYVSRKRCISHFNGLDLDGIRADQFLRNTCNQLIDRYKLKYSSIPEEATRDGTFLMRLLQQVSTIGEKIIIAVDALDEVESGESTRANILYLPRVLPEGIYFILTQIPGTSTLRLLSTPRKKINLGKYSVQNLQDIQEYIRRATQRPQLRTWLNNQGLEVEKFVALLAQKNENNFRYIYHVLEDIEGGLYQNIKFVNKLPTGLKDYYEIYWRRMGMASKPAPLSKLKVMRILVEARQPISSSLIAKLADRDLSIVQEILEAWNYFLREEDTDGGSIYSFYHTSFRNFLRQKPIIQTTEGIIAGINALAWRNLTSCSFEERNYALKHLPSHLVDDGKVEQICTLLTDFSFIEAKVAEVGLQLLLEDYDLVFTSNLLLSEEQANSLRLVQGAIRLSGRALFQDNNQLVGQLLGRLLFCELPLIQTMLEQAKQRQFACWLQPLTSSLTPPGESLLYTLWGHNNPVRTVALFSDGQRAVSASDNGELKVWDLITGRNLHTLRGHNDSVYVVAITPDEQQVISASDDGTLKVWNLEDGRNLHTLTGHDDWVRAVAIAPDGQRVVSASDDTTLKVWDLNSGENLRTLEGHDEEVRAVVITDDEQWVVSASNDNTLKVWNLENGSLIYTLQGHTDPITSLVLVPHQNQVISASQDKTVRVWDLVQGRCLKTLEGHSDRVSVVVVTPNGQRAVSVSEDQTLRIWNLNSGKSQPLEGHEKWVNSVAITPDGKQAITASDDKTLKIWDLDREQTSKSLEGHTNAVNGIVITPDGQRVVSASDDGTLKVWDLLSSKVDTSAKHRDQVRAVAVSRDGQWAVSASDDKTLKVWSLSNGTNLHTLEHTVWISTVTIPPNNQQVISGYGNAGSRDDGIITVQSLSNDDKLRTLTGHNAKVNAVAITPNGKWAVSASDDEKNNLKVWNLDSGTAMQTLAGHTASVNAVAVTCNGKLAVSASDDETLKVWDLTSGIILQTLIGHTNRVRFVRITPDGQRAVSASDDCTLKVWDLTTGITLQTLEGHTALVKTVAITTDGQRAVSAAYDSTLKVWDLRDGRALHTLEGHSNLVNDVVLTRDKYAISISEDWLLKIWDLHSGRVIANFTGDSGLLTCDIAPDGSTIFVGEKSGRVHFLRLQGV